MSHSVTADRFRRIALALEGVVEAFTWPSRFRIDKRIVASLHSGDRFGMEKLTPDQQALFMTQHPQAFSPESGAWGRSGCTRVTSTDVDEDALGDALTLAWRNARSTATTRRTGTPRRKSR